MGLLFNDKTCDGPVENRPHVCTPNIQSDKVFDICGLALHRGIQIINFLFLHENICCEYSLEGPLRDASNEYPQHTFFTEN